jgi:hypothetical protein
LQQKEKTFSKSCYPLPRSCPLRCFIYKKKTVGKEDKEEKNEDEFHERKEGYANRGHIGHEGGGEEDRNRKKKLCTRL